MSRATLQNSPKSCNRMPWSSHLSSCLREKRSLLKERNTYRSWILSLVGVNRACSVR